MKRHVKLATAFVLSSALILQSTGVVLAKDLNNATDVELNQRINDINGDLTDINGTTTDIAVPNTRTTPDTAAVEGSPNIVNVQRDNNIASFRDSVPNFVTDKLITQDTATKILTYLDSKEPMYRAEIEKIRNMREDQLKAGVNKPILSEFPNLDIYADLVKDSVITQAEADKLRNTMTDKNNDTTKRTLAIEYKELVDNGIISQATADKMADFVTTNNYAVMALAGTDEPSEEVQGALHFQQKADGGALYYEKKPDGNSVYFEQTPGVGAVYYEEKVENQSGLTAPKDLYNRMATAGVITQTEAEAIINFMNK